MSFIEKVAEAPNQREALLLIAGALDIILTAITEQQQAGPFGDGWTSDWRPNEVVPGAAGPPFVGEPEDYGQGAAARQPSPGLVQDSDGNWVIPPAPLELQVQRRMWAEQYLPGLSASTGDELSPANTGVDVDLLIDAYTKGGPEWLTAYDTEFVLTLPADARQAMALDYQGRGLDQQALEFSVAFLQGDATSMANTEPLGDTLPGAPR